MKLSDLQQQVCVAVEMLPASDAATALSVKAAAALREAQLLEARISAAYVLADELLNMPVADSRLIKRIGEDIQKILTTTDQT